MDDSEVSNALRQTNISQTLCPHTVNAADFQSFNYMPAKLRTLCSKIGPETNGHGKRRAANINQGELNR